MEFKDFGFNPRLLEGIEAMNYETATAIQQKAIPPILEGKDIIASAQTGTGKTAAFLLPIIHQIITNKKDEQIKALVIVPTRELAIQLDQHMEGLSYFTSVSSVAVYGGGDGALFSKEKKALTEGVNVVIGTPGRLIAHLAMGYVNFDELEYLILDEADRMLDMGFYNDIMKIISYLPEKRQNLLFSATMPKKINDLARKVLNDPEEIKIAVSKPAEKVKQVAMVVYDRQKIPLISHLLQAKKLKSVIVFCGTKASARELSKVLRSTDLTIGEIHSDLDQSERKKVLTSFKNRELKVLVATDVIARGIDIENIDLVINYDVPHDAEDYIHRIGRTARAESKGLAFTFVNEKEQGKFSKIENFLGKPVEKAAIPKIFGDTPDYRVSLPKHKSNRSKKFSKKKHGNKKSG